MLKLVLVATVGLVAAVQDPSKLDVTHRAEKVREVLASIPVPQSLHARRRLIQTHGLNHANAKETIVEIMDERNYYFQQSAAVSTLRSLGFQEHELPATGDDGLLVGHGE